MSLLSARCRRVNLRVSILEGLALRPGLGLRFLRIKHTETFMRPGLEGRALKGMISLRYSRAALQT